MLLKGKRILVTGASRGIGEATARLFAEQGASLMLSARSENVEALAEELNGTSEAGVYALAGDISDEDYTKRLVMASRKQLGGLDGLVNNAGILEQGLVGMIQLDSVRRMLEVNLVAMINLTQFSLRLMKEGSPSIVNVTSIAGTHGIEGISAYCASKAAVIGLTKSLAKEVAPSGVRVNAVAPGFIDTQMARQLDDDWFQERVESVRMKRIGTPLDVANLSLYLCSDLSTYVTGQTIGVDGGMQV